MKRLLAALALLAAVAAPTSGASFAVRVNGCDVVLTTDNPEVTAVRIYLVVDPEENPGTGAPETWETLEVVGGVADTLGTWPPGTYEADWGDGTSDRFTIPAECAEPEPEPTLAPALRPIGRQAPVPTMPPTDTE